MSTPGGDDRAGEIEHQASAQGPARVAPGAHLTLHYRVSL
ncbi:MAG: hypothetical protein RLZZ153_2512, partial [Pseudomonadota bacterium]